MLFLADIFRTCFFSSRPWRLAPLMGLATLLVLDIFVCVRKDRVFFEVNNKLITELCFAVYKEL